MNTRFDVVSRRLRRAVSSSPRIRNSSELSIVPSTVTCFDWMNTTIDTGVHYLHPSQGNTEAMLVHPESLGRKIYMLVPRRDKASWTLKLFFRRIDHIMLLETIECESLITSLLLDSLKI